tara:strand:- start:270 stop:1034 length:765 start_codon:yes stop_codon:yes gene_type:complete
MHLLLALFFVFTINFISLADNKFPQPIQISPVKIDSNLLKEHSNSLSLRGAEDLESAKTTMKIISKISYNLYVAEINEDFFQKESYSDELTKALTVAILEAKIASSTIFDDSEKLNNLYSKYINMIKNGEKNKKTMATLDLIQGEVFDLTYKEYGDTFLSGVDIGEIAGVYNAFLQYAIRENNYDLYQSSQKYFLLPLLKNTTKWKPKYINRSMERGLEYLERNHSENLPDKKTFTKEKELIVDSFKPIVQFVR